MTAKMLSTATRAAAVALRDTLAADPTAHPTAECPACRGWGYVAREAYPLEDGRVACVNPERHAALPEVGLGATLCYPSDRYGYVVTAVSPTGAKVTIEELEHPSMTTGHAPEGNCNGFPVWNHTYTAEELTSMRTGRTRTLHRNRRGYSDHGLPVSFGGARYFRNFAD